jgi:hypothetical protein
MTDKDKTMVLNDLVLECDGMQFTLSPDGVRVERGLFTYHFRWDALIPVGRLIHQRYQLNKQRLYDSSRLLIEIHPMIFRFFNNEVCVEVSELGVAIRVRECDGEPDYTDWGLIPRKVLQDRSIKSPSKRITTYMNLLKRQRKNARKHEACNDETTMLVEA